MFADPELGWMTLAAPARNEGNVQALTLGVQAHWLR